MPTHLLHGRAAGLTEEKLAHLGDDPLPVGVYEPAEAAIIRYVRAHAGNDTITDELYADLAAHYSLEQMIEICFTAGLSAMIGRFHKTFLTELDPDTQEILAESCPTSLPDPPTAAT